jgi:hypothetical protein
MGIFPPFFIKIKYHMGLLSYTTSGNLACTVPEDQLTKTRVIYPVSLCEIKRHLRIDNDFVDDDNYLIQIRNSAVQLAENYLNKAIAKTSNVLRINNFNSDTIKIYEGNFLSMISVLNSSSVAITTTYTTNVHYDFFTLYWSAYVCSDPIYLNFYTGYEEDVCPELIKQSILIKTADLYDSQRADTAWGGLTNQRVFENILDGFTAIRF